MEQSLIVICDQKSVVFGEEFYQSSIYGIKDLAEAMDSDEFEVRESLLAIGGEVDSRPFITENDFREALTGAPNYGQYYDADEHECIEKAVRSAMKNRRDVFCSFSLCL